jgi:hypothetical protein
VLPGYHYHSGSAIKVHSEQAYRYTRTEFIRNEAFLLRRWIANLPACLAGALAGCLVFPGAAAAVTSPPAFQPQLTGPQAVTPFAASGERASKVTAHYSCDFSGYGTGIGHVGVSMTSQVFSPWPAGEPDQVTVLNNKVTLPPAVTSKLSGVDSIEVKSQVTAKHASRATIALETLAISSSAATLTEIPQIPADGQVTFPAKGTAGSLAFPAQKVTFTPKAGATAKPAITCTTTTAAHDVAVTVGSASGSFYHCAVKAGSTPTGVTAGPVPLNITESGTPTTGDSLTVTLSSASIARTISQMAASLTPSGVTLNKAAFTASIPVTGAQSGTLHMTKTITDLTAATFSAPVHLKLANAGTVKIDIPSAFAVSFSGSGGIAVSVSCTLVTKPTPAALTLTVAQGPGSSGGTGSGNGSSGETSDTGSAADTAATPAGGAATGGGVAPGSDTPLVLGGAALALAGGGLLLARFRPRRRRTWPGGSSGPGDAGSGDAPDAG